MKKLIKVTQKDIDSIVGTDYSTESCPVAKAINRAFKKKTAYIHGEGQIYKIAKFGEYKHWANFNNDVACFVKNFDRYSKNKNARTIDEMIPNVTIPKPFEFWLET